jgi:hypothetical protein
MSFSIVTYCSRNYKDAIDLTLDSWLGTQAEEIFVYCDWRWKTTRNRVVTVKLFDEETDWLINCGRKVEVARHFCANTDRHNIVFLDSDCYLVRDISEIFNNDAFDLGVTRLEGRTATCGVWFARNCASVRTFMQEWLDLSENYFQLGKGVIPHRTAYEQYAFDRIVREAEKSAKPCRVRRFNTDIYNNEDDNRHRWLSKIRQTKPSIIHFKHNAYRDRDFVREALELATS